MVGKELRRQGITFVISAVRVELMAGGASGPFSENVRMKSKALENNASFLSRGGNRFVSNRRYLLAFTFPWMILLTPMVAWARRNNSGSGLQLADREIKSKMYFEKPVLLPVGQLFWSHWLSHFWCRDHLNHVNFVFSLAFSREWGLGWRSQNFPGCFLNSLGAHFNSHKYRISTSQSRHALWLFFSAPREIP